MGDQCAQPSLPSTDVVQVDARRCYLGGSRRFLPPGRSVAKFQGSDTEGKKPLEKAPKNPPETKF